MPSYPRCCPKCGVMTAEGGFSIDRSKPGGRKSHCKTCDGQRAQVYYDTHKDELYAKRVATREAAWQAELEAQVEEHRKRVAAAKKLHAAQVRRQKELLRSIGVPDLSPDRAQRKGRILVKSRPNGRSSRGHGRASLVRALRRDLRPDGRPPHPDGPTAGIR